MNLKRIQILTSWQGCSKWFEVCWALNTFGRRNTVTRKRCPNTWRRSAHSTLPFRYVFDRGSYWWLSSRKEGRGSNNRIVSCGYFDWRPGFSRNIIGTGYRGWRQKCLSSCVSPSESCRINRKDWDIFPRYSEIARVICRGKKFRIYKSIVYDIKASANKHRRLRKDWSSSVLPGECKSRKCCF